MLVRRLARPLLAGIFIAGGVDAVRQPEGKAGVAAPVALATARALPLPLPDDPAALVRLDGAVKVVAGLLLALGRLPRLSALALAGSLVPTTLAAHRFWDVDDPEGKARQRLQFLKNAGLLGGLLLAAVDTEGAPSLGWRARRAMRGGRARADGSEA